MTVRAPRLCATLLPAQPACIAAALTFSIAVDAAEWVPPPPCSLLSKPPVHRVDLLP